MGRPSVTTEQGMHTAVITIDIVSYISNITFTVTSSVVEPVTYLTAGSVKYTLNPAVLLGLAMESGSTAAVCIHIPITDNIN